MASPDLLAGLVLYLAAMIGIGIWSARHVEGLDDFLLGGRRLGPWVTAVSERASGESAWFLMGLPGAAYAAGFREFWSVIGIAGGVLVSWVLIALPLRRATERLGALTLPEFLAASYPRLAQPLRIVATLAIIVFYVSYLGAQILGAGKLFQSLLGWSSITWGALLGAGIVATYTLLGGFLAVAWTDLLQGLLMMVVAVVLPLLALAHLGYTGLTEGLSVRSAPFFAMGNFALPQAAQGLGFGAAVGGLAWGLGYLGQPHLLTRYMAINKPEQLKRATQIAMGWVLLAYWGVTLAGIVAVPVLGPKIADNELVIADLARALLPGWAAGLVMAGILAAIMSTADSQLLVATSSIVEDCAVKLLGLRLGRRQTVSLSRVATVAITLVALLPLLSAGGERLVYSIVAYAWTGLGSTFGPALILTLWWRRTSATGVLAGMIAGIATTILWKNAPALNEALDLKIVGFAIASLAVVVGSLVRPDTAELRARTAA